MSEEKHHHFFNHHKKDEEQPAGEYGYSETEVVTATGEGEYERYQRGGGTDLLHSQLDRLMKTTSLAFGWTGLADASATDLGLRRTQHLFASVSHSIYCFVFAALFSQDMVLQRLKHTAPSLSL
uniref:Abscisic stress ripening protein 2 n=1 Tax=Zea mays TaxID=4577 RepID=B6SX13_MAIZE|nr:abscisic stress ripening protein 2 [Zea mays]